MLPFILFTLPTYAQEQRNVSVSATVPPKNADFQFAFTSNAYGRVPQAHTVTYEITYGAYETASLSVDTTISVDFNDNLTDKGIRVTDYIYGSATVGYGNAQPIVDLEENTITWNIKNLPAGTINQKIYFQVRTNTHYTGEKISYFDTYASLSNDYVSFPTLKMTHEYLYDPSLVTPGPTQPVAAPIITVIPTPISTAPRILSISYPAISDKNAQIAITANKPVKRLIRFGTDPNNLNQTAQNAQFRTTDIVELNNLTPLTEYYFKVTATDLTGRSITSDIITFKTASTALAPLLAGNAVVISSGGNVVLSDVLNGNNIPFSLLLTQSDYTVTYTFGNFIPLAGLELVIRDNNGSEINVVEMIGSNPRVYTTTLRSGDAGIQTLYIRLRDQNGNVTEQKIAVIKLTSRLQVLELESNIPIADARIVISKFNKQTKRFEPLNPMFTNTNGELELLLPQGRYKAEASAFGYAAAAVEFQLGSNANEVFPTIYLKKDPFNISALITFIFYLIADMLTWIINALKAFLQSSRFYNTAASVAVGSFAALSLLLFTFRTDIRWRDIPAFFIFHTIVLRKKHKELYLYGVILDPARRPVSRARIEIYDVKKNTVLAYVLSNKNGSFSIRNTFKQMYVKLQVMKEGYAAAESLVATDSKDLIRIQLDEHSNQSKTIRRGLKHIFGELFELVLLLTLIAELLFIINFGVAKTLPFFLLSIFNLFLWVFFQREKKIY